MLRFFSFHPVHPHACGEHLSLFFEFVVILGSSPRMWGTFVPRMNIIRQLRFIPTHVGNISAYSADSASRFRRNPPPCSDSKRHPIPGETATPDRSEATLVFLALSHTHRICRGQAGIFFSQGVSFHGQGYFMGVMDQPVEDGIGNGGIADLLMPVFHGELTGDNG